MKKGTFIAIIVLTFILEFTFCSILFNKTKTVKQDVIKINECVKTVEENFGSETFYYKDLEYSVIDTDNKLIYKTSESTTESLNDAIKHNDIILDLEVNNEKVGTILIKNNTSELIYQYKLYLYSVIIIMSIIQLVLIIMYFHYINKNVIKPFKELDDFASRVASGNLDIPLYMDKNHIFGSFTESFDLMRTELKKSRILEKKASDDKKEMVAKLSHDIKTPIASIKSTSEIGYEKADDKDIKNYFNQINIKTDQIKVLVDNLFNSSINEITEIDVSPSKYESSILEKLIKNADYLEKLNSFSIPKCDVYIDKMRMQQTFDNIINNSYKYANTNIDIEVNKTKEYLIISFRDYGMGVSDLDLPLLKEKYKRGSNVKDEDGAGLGLHLANYFMENMNGKLELENAHPGFTVKLYLRII